jgi:hypothetical protein
MARIVGGLISQPHSWPAAIWLKFVFNKWVFLNDTLQWNLVKFNASCGGTLINQNTVLTAAHCIVTSFNFQVNHVTYTQLVDMNPQYYYVYMGFQNVTNSSEPLGVIKRVTKITPVMFNTHTFIILIIKKIKIIILFFLDQIASEL